MSSGQRGVPIREVHRETPVLTGHPQEVLLVPAFTNLREALLQEAPVSKDLLQVGLPVAVVAIGHPVDRHEVLVHDTDRVV